MAFFQTSRSVIIVSMVLGLGNVAAGAEKENKTMEKEKAQPTVHTVEASMGYPTSGGIGIRAEKQPGEFTIPKGSKGTKLKYSFHDSKSDRTLTRLNGRNIYSVTEHRYMEELDKEPNFELPPGDYKFVVGGQPGASGTLTYTTVTSAKNTPKDKTTITKETSKGDKTKLSGNVVRKKVTVHTRTNSQCEYGSNSAGEGDVPAYLTIEGKKFILDFDMYGNNPIEGITAKLRWEGTLEDDGGSVSVQGTTALDLKLTSAQGQGYMKMSGTFSGKLDGNVLSGTASHKGEYKPIAVVPKPIQTDEKWSIEGVAQ